MLRRRTAMKRSPMKRKRSPSPSSAERAHMNRVAQKGCLVCGRPATVHHVTGWADRMGRFARSDKLVVPLCPMHHQAVHDPLASDPVSVENLNHQGFFKKHGIDLKAEAERLWEETCALLGS